MARRQWAFTESMAHFEKTDGPGPDEDIIVIHLGRTLSELEYKAVLDSVIAFMNKRWPNGQYQIPN